MPLSEEIKSEIKSEFEVAEHAMKEIARSINPFGLKEFHTTWALLKTACEIFDSCLKKDKAEVKNTYQQIPWDDMSQLRHGLVHFPTQVTQNDLLNFFHTYHSELKNYIQNVLYDQTFTNTLDITQSVLYRNTRNYQTQPRLITTEVYSKYMLEIIQNIATLLKDHNQQGKFSRMTMRAIQNNIEIFGEICEKIINPRAEQGDDKAKQLVKLISASGKFSTLTFKTQRDNSAHNIDTAGTINARDVETLAEGITPLLEGDLEQGVQGLRYLSAHFNNEPAAKIIGDDFLKRAIETQLRKSAAASNNKAEKQEEKKGSTDNIEDIVKRVQAQRAAQRVRAAEKLAQKSKQKVSEKEEKKDEDKEEKKQPAKRKADADPTELDEKDPQKPKLSDAELAGRTHAEGYGSILSSQGNPPSSSSSMSSLANSVSVKPPSSTEAMTSTAPAHSSSSSSSSSSTYKTDSDPTPPSSNKPPSL